MSSSSERKIARRGIRYQKRNIIQEQQQQTTLSPPPPPSPNRSPSPLAENPINHPIGGAEPETCFLDVIPEARALYKNGGPKRKKIDLGQKKAWEYREKRQISMDSVTETPISVSTASSEDETNDANGDDDYSAGEQDDNADGDVFNSHLPVYCHPLMKVPRKRHRRAYAYKEVLHQIDDIMKDFRLTDATYCDIMELLEEEMKKGLRKDTHSTSTVRMFPTYVRNIPDGSENGRFLALDLGGTNFRVLLVDLNGREQPIMRSKVFLISHSTMMGSGTQLFDHIATCMAEFVEAEEGLKGGLGPIPLGFTFSFPCYQDGLASARLVRWTKGFRCSGTEGEDVVRMLMEAVQRRGDLNVECMAIINDPVGALMAGAHVDPDCCVGLILGTGTNCCYMENLSEVELWDADHNDPKQVIVNTEWGAFGDNQVLDFIRNVFDRELDLESINPGHQLFEKMISGMYMGEIVRLVICELVSQRLLFGGDASDVMFTPNSFLTKYISEIESDSPTGNYPNTKLILQELEIPHFTMDDCRHVQHVCWQVSQRAAYLAGTAVATVIKRLERNRVTVAVDGSLYRFHPHFKDLMSKKIRQLLPKHIKFELVLSHDGSGKGAALVAAVAQRQNNTIHSRSESMEDIEEEGTP